MYAPLWCKSNFSFLEGASHPEELVEEAHRVGITTLALTDRDGVYGMVRGFTKARDLGIKLICGAQVSIAAPGSLLAPSPITPHICGSRSLQLPCMRCNDDRAPRTLTAVAP